MQKKPPLKPLAVKGGSRGNPWLHLRYAARQDLRPYVNAVLIHPYYCYLVRFRSSCRKTSQLSCLRQLHKSRNIPASSFLHWTHVLFSIYRTGPESVCYIGRWEIASFSTDLSAVSCSTRAMLGMLHSLRPSRLVRRGADLCRNVLTQNCLTRTRLPNPRKGPALNYGFVEVIKHNATASNQCENMLPSSLYLTYSRKVRSYPL